MYLSLRNKTEDIERALAAGDIRWARMAALELGVRLSHTTTSPPLQATCEGQADAEDQSTEEALSAFGEDLERLLGFLKKNEAAHASEVAQQLFLLLDTLDHKGSQ